jgi:hypothetical protein
MYLQKVISRKNKIKTLFFVGTLKVYDENSRIRIRIRYRMDLKIYGKSIAYGFLILCDFHLTAQVQLPRGHPPEGLRHQHLPQVQAVGRHYFNGNGVAAPPRVSGLQRSGGGGPGAARPQVAGGGSGRVTVRGGS